MKKAAEYLISISALIVLTGGGLTYFVNADDFKLHKLEEDKIHISLLELMKSEQVERVEHEIRKLLRTPIGARDAFHNDDLVGLQNRKARLLR